MRIVVFAGFSLSLLNFRKELLKNMVSEGHSVTAFGPESGYEDELRKIGANFRLIKFNRLSLNPLNDILLTFRLIKMFYEEKPELYLGYTIKPVIFGSIAAYFSGVKKRYSMVTGLGSVFIDGKEKKKYLKEVVKILYKFGFYFSQKVFFQNQDDINEMVEMKLINKSKCLKVNGSGVNLQFYTKSELPTADIFLFIGSIIKNKGIEEYMKAAEIVKKKYPQSEFWIVGPRDNRLSKISDQELDYYLKNGIVKYFGEVPDVRGYLDKCRYYVLPSYREGTPRSVLEAMAKGRPIITTDAPGCRETVQDGENGFLVPVMNYKTLAEKMIWMIENPEKVDRMAVKSYEIVKEKYDVEKVNSKMLSEMGIV